MLTGKAVEAREMLLLLSYIVEKQGTHGFWPNDPEYHRVTFQEIERDFGIPAGEVPERINELTSYISAGSDLVFNMLQVDLTDHAALGRWSSLA